MDLVAEELWRELTTSHRNSFEVYRLRPPFVKRFGWFNGHARSSAASIADRLLNRFVDYPRFLKVRRKEFDLFHLIDHSYSHLAQILAPRPALVTCHDTDAFRCILEKQSGNRSRLLRRITQSVLMGFRSAAAVACDSAATRDQVLRYDLISAERLSVNRNGVARCFNPHPDLSAEAELSRLLGSCEPRRAEILHVGSTIPRKRVDVLLRSFAAVARELPAARLIKVGGAFTAAQRELIRELSLPRDSVAVLPFVNGEGLAALYRRATIAVLPSESEGFGLPALEALACGTPAVLSDIPVFHEIAGDAATFCRVGDIDAWARAIFDLIRERETQPQEFRERRADGIRWAGQFTWEMYARRAASLYQTLLAA